MEQLMKNFIKNHCIQCGKRIFIKSKYFGIVQKDATEYLKSGDKVYFCRKCGSVFKRKEIEK